MWVRYLLWVRSQILWGEMKSMRLHHLEMNLIYRKNPKTHNSFYKYLFNSHRNHSENFLQKRLYKSCNSNNPYKDLMTQLIIHLLAVLDHWTRIIGLDLKLPISIRHMPQQFRESKLLPNRQSRYNRWRKIWYMRDKDFQWWYAKKEKLAQYFQMIIHQWKLIMKLTRQYCRRPRPLNIKRLIFR